MGNPEDSSAAAALDAGPPAPLIPEPAAAPVPEPEPEPEPEPVTAATTTPPSQEPLTEDLTGPLAGWKRKLSGKTTRGTPGKKKDVSFVAPDGEEIRTKRQLDKYLKAHPGTITASDFEWGGPAGDAAETPPENRRRSARLNSKGRITTEGVEEDIEPKQPVVKRSRKSRENGKDDTEGVVSKGEPVSSDKEKENGEAKAMDVDVAEETKEIPAETLTEKSEDEKPTSTKPASETLDNLTKPATETLDILTKPLITEVAKENDTVEKATTEEAEVPPPQGIHALVGEVPKSQGTVEGALQEPEAVL